MIMCRWLSLSSAGTEPDTSVQAWAFTPELKDPTLLASAVGGPSASMYDLEATAREGQGQHSEQVLCIKVHSACVLNKHVTLCMYHLVFYISIQMDMFKKIKIKIMSISSAQQAVNCFLLWPKYHHFLPAWGTIKKYIFSSYSYCDQQHAEQLFVTLTVYWISYKHNGIVILRRLSLTLHQAVQDIGACSIKWLIDTWIVCSMIYCDTYILLAENCLLPMQECTIFLT